MKKISLRRRKDGGSASVLAKIFELPPGMLPGRTCVTVYGRDTAVVENIGRITLCRSETIYLRAKENDIKLTGSDLCVTTLGRKSIMIKGHIVTVEII